MIPCEKGKQSREICLCLKNSRPARPLEEPLEILRCRPQSSCPGGAPGQGLTSCDVTCDEKMSCFVFLMLSFGLAKSPVQTNLPDFCCFACIDTLPVTAEEDVPKVLSAKSVLRVQKGRPWQATNVEIVVLLRLDGLGACCLCSYCLCLATTSPTGRCLGLARFKV